MDIPNRTELERRLALKLGRVLGRLRNELFSIVPDLPPESYWSGSEAALSGVLRPELNSIADSAAERLLATLPLEIEWALYNEAAANWASEYAGQQVRRINGATQRGVASAVGNYFSQGQTIGELQGNLARFFNARRAMVIAVTEITRAAAEGERLLAQQVAQDGLLMRAVWRTNADELVCPICGPLSGVRADNSGYFVASSGVFDSPPAHVGCRCWINHELLS